MQERDCVRGREKRERGNGRRVGGGVIDVPIEKLYMSVFSEYSSFRNTSGAIV